MKSNEFLIKTFILIVCFLSLNALTDILTLFSLLFASYFASFNSMIGWGSVLFATIISFFICLRVATIIFTSRCSSKEKTFTFLVFGGLVALLNAVLFPVMSDWLFALAPFHWSEIALGNFDDLAFRNLVFTTIAAIVCYRRTIRLVDG